MNLLPLVVEQHAVHVPTIPRSLDRVDSTKALNYDNVRIPLSPLLLEELDTIRSTHQSNEAEIQRATIVLKQTLKEYVDNLETKNVPREILQAFSEDPAQIASEDIQPNWEGIVLKIHIAALESEQAYEFLKDIRKKRTISSAMEPPTPTPKHFHSITSSMPEPAVSDKKTNLLRDRAPQLLKTGSPFIPIKTQREPVKVNAARPQIQEPRVAGTMTRSDSGGMPSPTDEVGLSTSGPSAVGAKMLKSSYDDPFDDEDTQFGTSWKGRTPTIQLGSSAPTSAFGSSAPISVGMYGGITSPPLRRKPSGPLDKDADYPEDNFEKMPNIGSLPPTRLTESLARSSGIGQSFIYSKNAPAIDPVAKSLPPSDLVSPPSSFRLNSSMPELPEELAPAQQLMPPEISPISIISPSSYFRRTETETNLAEMAFNKAHFSKKAVYPYKSILPEWTDVLLYWGVRDPEQEEAGIHLEIESVLLALRSRGYYDLWLRSALSHQLFETISKLKVEEVPPELQGLVELYVETYKSKHNEQQAAAQLANEIRKLKAYPANRFTQYAQLLVFNEAEAEKFISKIEDDLLLHLRANHKESVEKTEKLLISALGHPRPGIREAAVRLLNILYDGHDWQTVEALVPSVRTIGDSFAVEFDLAGSSVDDSNVYLQVNAPQRKSGQKSEYFLSLLKPTKKGTKLSVTQMGTFKSAGYYDWRFVTLDSDGSLKPLVTHKDMELSKVQGRVIVHPHIRDDVVHEVWAELQDCEWDRNTGNILKRGNFNSIKHALPQYKRSFGVTTLYVMGALDRPSWCGPFSPIDRSTPNKALGGAKDFDEMVAAANNTGIKIVVDSTARVSSKAAHRKYNNLVCKVLDEDETLAPHPGTDGRDFKWDDCVLLNYRKKSTWDLHVAEIRDWAKRGVSGVRLDSAHSWPLILQPDMDELLRQDSDNLNHYTLDEIMDGEVVQPSRNEGINYGYHGTAAAQTYPNPLFIKMTKELWAEFPTFIFFAEIYWGREVNAATSGLIPYCSSLPTSLASIFNIELHKDGRILYSPEKRNVSSLYNWYEIERARFPQNSILLYPSSSHHIPYPTAIMAHGAWAAIDLLFFLPEIPATYIGEQLGWMMNPDVTKNKFTAPDFNRFNTQRDLIQIKGHYEHRSTLRKNYSVLREGGMIPLFTFYGEGWHDRVFAFARFTKHEGPEIAVVAINLNDTESIFYIDCSPLKEICDNSSSVLIRTVDLLNPANPPQYFTTNEFLYEKNFVRLPPYGSLCWGVFAEAQTSTTERVLYEHSMMRLQRNLYSNVDPSNNLVYDMLITKGLDSLDNFTNALLDLSGKQGPQSENNLPPFLQNVIYYTTWGKEAQETKALAYLTYQANNTNADPLIRNICKTALQSNQMGPIVFITPEIGRFSTVGGVGVMVNELTQALAALGFDIHVVSPYYNYNRKGQTGYLKGEGIDYVQNVITYVGNEYVEVGVHRGKEHGVTLHFLHNWKYFSTPYHTGSPQHQLQTIVLIAKASLELCCQLRLLPSIIVTNDWFCGLVPGYAKRSGAFGTTFVGTTFMHVVHNLEEGYEGKIYPEDDEDLSYIHQLSNDLIMEQHANSSCLNASRCALLSADQWGTVSLSYRNDLMKTSPLQGLLCRFPSPFAMLNGIRLTERLNALKKVASSHDEAKKVLQTKYFQNADPAIPVFSFVGRIVLQKGVHLILNSVGELIAASGGRIQIIVGGMANMKDPYAAQCAWSMQALRRQYPHNFWADPNEFFTDGSLLNIGSDFGLMPSLFEPSGVVQQEYFSGGTPVIVFKTGGLKDSVFEFDQVKATGNGFTFESHAHSDFVQAVRRSLAVYNNKAHYAQLRQQARDSVLDMETVAIVWTKEFTRLRKRTWVPPFVLNKFIEDNLVKKEEPVVQKTENLAETVEIPKQ